MGVTTPATVGPEHPGAGAPAATGRRLQVLLVDDSSIVCERLIALIHQLERPIQVTATADGAQAISLFQQLHPDVVVLDIELPNINGFALLVEFKLQRPGCVVMMLTTYAYPEFNDNALRLGADYFFSKALEFERVPEVLSSLAGSPLPPP